MSSDSFDHRRTTTAKPHHTGGSAAVAPPPEPEHLPCPRCDSTNTKFCYYNNYNFSQPRHFCKSCRRYWTHGGTLRDIPVGGGSRRNAKRSRLTTTTTTNSHYNSTLDQFRHMDPVPAAAPILFPFAGDHGGALRFSGDGTCESFTSLLNSAQGFGVGGFDDGGFAFGRGVWPFSGVGDGGHYGGGGGGGGERLSLPELAISTPGGM